MTTARVEGGDGPLPLAASSPGPDGEALANSILQRLSVLSGPASESTMVMTSSWAAASQAPGPVPVVQRDTTDTSSTASATTTTSTAPAAADTTATATVPVTTAPNTSGKRPSDQELHNLSYWLYPFISHRLKGELREGRERAGLLTDSYRRW
jgi:hypothetical protein